MLKGTETEDGERASENRPLNNGELLHRREMRPTDTSSSDVQTKEKGCGFGTWGVSRERASGSPNKKLRGPAKNNMGIPKALENKGSVCFPETLCPGRKLKPKTKHSDRDYETGKASSKRCFLETGAKSCETTCSSALLGCLIPRHDFHWKSFFCPTNLGHTEINYQSSAMLETLRLPFVTMLNEDIHLYTLPIIMYEI